MGEESWFFAGSTSSFTDLNLTSEKSAARQKLKHSIVPRPPCLFNDANSPEITEHNDITPAQAPVAFKVFRVPSSPLNSPPTELDPESAVRSETLNEQVMVFQYRDKFHAIDHQCPHSSYPLCKGSIYDIEDFGIVLSAGISCPKHGWSFDLHTGLADRGAYRLRIWKVEIREETSGTTGVEPGQKEVWVQIQKREKKRYG